MVGVTSSEKLESLKSKIIIFPSEPPIHWLHCNLLNVLFIMILLNALFYFGSYINYNLVEYCIAGLYLKTMQ